MKSNKRLLIESMLRDGLHPMRAIARTFGISAARVRPTRAEVRELWNVDEAIKVVPRERGWII